MFEVFLDCRRVDAVYSFFSPEASIVPGKYKLILILGRKNSAQSQYFAAADKFVL